MAFNEEEKQKLAAEMATAFQQHLGKKVAIQQILVELDKSQKLGVTNLFIKDFVVDGSSYLIRVNGKLWDPYTREQEATTLSLLEKAGIETAVLYNGEKFQICTTLDERMKFSSILRQGNPHDIERATILVAKIMPKYQNLQYQTLTYPLASMISNANKTLIKKYEHSPDDLIRLKLLGEACEKILKVLTHSTQDKFNHCDLQPDSIVVDLEHSRVTIVDWEYAALAHWSTDLAMLSRYLTSSQADFFAEQYYAIKSGKSDSMSSDQKLELQFSKFLHDYLTMAWKSLANIKESIAKMEQKLEDFGRNLEIRYNRVMSSRDSFFKSGGSKPATQNAGANENISPAQNLKARL